MCDNMELDLSDTNLCRTAEEVREIVHHAKLHESELTKTVQILRILKPRPEHQNYKLVQLDNELLTHIKSNGELLFKGSADDKAVLCTHNKTYDVKEAETSNSLLLVPDLLFGASTVDENFTLSTSVDSDNSLDNSLNKSNQSDENNHPDRVVEHKNIIGTFFTYYELRPTKPKVNKIKTLLEKTKYEGPEQEYKVDETQLLDFEQLFQEVQASREELKSALVDIQAVELDGKYRLLDFDYEFRVLSYMLDLIDENSWTLDRVVKEVTLESLKELVPAEVLTSVFEFYTVRSDCIDGVEYYKYDERKVCVFLARVLLKNAGKFNASEFMQAWRDSVPEGMKVDESMLWGEAITSGGVIWSFPERDLPELIDERFKIIFQAKPKWTESEILPYIKCYTTDKVNAAALLTRHARSERGVDGVRLYSARHAR